MTNPVKQVAFFKKKSNRWTRWGSVL